MMPVFSSLSFDGARGRKMGWTVLLLVVACSFFVSLGLSEVVDINEGLRLMPALEMLEKGDWVVPRIDGEVYINKPPLVYWILAASYKIAGGPGLLAGRIPIALVCLLTVLAIAWIGRRRISEGAGVWAGLILATAIYFHQKAQKAELDPFLTFAVVAGAYFYWKALQCEGRRRDWGWTTLAAGVLFGAGFMLKGPVIFPFLLAATLAVAVAVRPRWGLLGLSLGAIVALAVMIAVPWCALLIHRLGWNEVWYILHRESLERLVKSTPINSGKIYFYLVQVSSSFLPWTPLLLFWPLRAFRDHIRRENKPFFRFAAWFTLFSFIIFSLIKGKETEYLLPVFPYLALLCGTILDWLTRPGGAPEGTWRWLRGGLILFAAAACLAPAMLAWPVKFHWIRLTWPTTLPMLAGALVLGVITMRLLLTRRGTRVAQTLACIMSFALVISSGDNLRKSRDNQNEKKSPLPLFEAVQRESAGATLYRKFSNRPHDLWYLRRISTPLSDVRQLPEILAQARGPVMMLMRHKNIASFEKLVQDRVEFIINPHVPKEEIILMTVKLKTLEKGGNQSAEK